MRSIAARLSSGGRQRDTTRSGAFQVADRSAQRFSQTLFSHCIYIQWQNYTIQNCLQVNHKLTTGNPQPAAKGPFVLKNMRAKQANRAGHAGFWGGRPEVSLGNPVPRFGWVMIRRSSSNNMLCPLGR